MRHLFPRLLVVAALLAPAIAAAQPINPPPTGTVQRRQGNQTPQYVSMEDPQFWEGSGLTPATGVAQHMTLPCTLAAGSGALNVGTPVSATATVAVSAYQYILTVAGATPFLFHQNGEPISITNIGPGGGTLNTKIEAWLSTTVVMLHDPVQTAYSGSVTINVGNVFTAAAIGSVIKIGYIGQNVGGIGSGGGLYTGTITAVTDSADVTISPVATAACPISTSAGSIFATFTWGPDVSAVGRAVIAAAEAPKGAFGLRRVAVNQDYMVPSLGAQAVNVKYQGDGNLWFSPYPTNVIPPWAPQPHPATKTLDAAFQLPNLAAAPTPITVAGGDSRLVDSAPGAELLHWTPAQVDRWLDTANPGRGLQPMARRGIIGMSCLQVDTTFGTYPANFGVSAGTPYLSGVIAPLKPSMFLLDCGPNDIIGSLPTDSMFDIVRQVQAFVPPTDLVIGDDTIKTSSYGATSGCAISVLCTYGWADQAAFWSGFAKVYGLPYTYDWRQVSQIELGVDPAEINLVRYPFVNADNDTSSSLLPTGTASWTPDFATTDYAMSVLNGVASPTVFWADSGEIVHQIGSYGDNVLRLGQIPSGLAGEGDFYYECDIRATEPGAGCWNTVGVPPVTPLPLSSISVSSVTTPNSVTSTVSMFTSAMENEQLVVPGASSTTYGVGGYNSYLRCPNGAVPFIHFVSPTNVTLFTNSGHGTPCPATQTVSAVSELVWIGEPRVDSGISITGDASARMTYFFTVDRDALRISYQTAAQIAYLGPVVRFYGTPFPPFMGRTATSETLSVGDDTQNGLPAYYVAEPEFVQQALWDGQVFSLIQPWTGDNAAIPGPHEGADGHGSTLEKSAVFDPVYGAQNWALGPRKATATYANVANAPIGQIPSKNCIGSIVLTETSRTGPISVNVGTTSGGTDVISGLSVPSGGGVEAAAGGSTLLKPCPGEGSTLFLSAASWSTEVVNARVNYVEGP
jgi:hypothetical protein